MRSLLDSFPRAICFSCHGRHSLKTGGIRGRMILGPFKSLEIKDLPATLGEVPPPPS